MDLAISADHRIKIKENEKRYKYADITRELKKAMEHEGDSDTNCNWCTRNNPQRLGKCAGKKWKSEYEEIIQTTEWLRLARILRRVQKTYGDLLSLRLP